MADWGLTALGGILGGLGGGMGAVEDQRAAALKRDLERQQLQIARDRLQLEQRQAFADPEEAKQLMSLFGILGGAPQGTAIATAGSAPAALNTSVAEPGQGGFSQLDTTGIPAVTTTASSPGFQLGPGAAVPRSVLNALITTAAGAAIERQKEAFKVGLQRQQQSDLSNALLTEANAAARPAVPPALAGSLQEGEDPEAAAMIPRTPGVAAVPPDPTLIRQARLALGGMSPSDLMKMEELRQQQPGFDLVKRLLAGQDINAPSPSGAAPMMLGGQPVTLNLSGGKVGLQTHLTESAEDKAASAMFGQGTSYGSLDSGRQQMVRDDLQQRALNYAGAQGQQAAMIAQTQPLKPTDLEGFVSKTTGQHPPVGLSLRDIVESKDYVAVSPQQAPAIRQVKTAESMLNSVEQVIMSRPDIWPPSTGSAAQDALAVSRARLNYTALTSALSPFKGTDADIATFESNTAGLPAIARGFGDVGNIAREEQRIAGEAIGLQGAQSREAALARLENVRKLFNGGLQQAGLPLLTSPYAPKEGQSGGGQSAEAGREPVYVRNQSTGEIGKWAGTMPLPSGMQEVPPWQVTQEGLGAGRTPQAPAAPAPAPARQIRVRDTRTKKEGTWDGRTPLPPGVEVIQ